MGDCRVLGDCVSARSVENFDLTISYKEAALATLKVMRKYLLLSMAVAAAMIPSPLCGTVHLCAHAGSTAIPHLATCKRDFVILSRVSSRIKIF